MCFGFCVGSSVDFGLILSLAWWFGLVFLGEADMRCYPGLMAEGAGPIPGVVSLLSELCPRKQEFSEGCFLRFEGFYRHSSSSKKQPQSNPLVGASFWRFL